MSFFIGKFNNSSPSNPSNPTVTYRQEFTATNNQTLFTLNQTYKLNSNQVKVYVSGISQFSPSNFTETSVNSITLSEGVPTGTIVVVEITK